MRAQVLPHATKRRAMTIERPVLPVSATKWTGVFFVVAASVYLAVLCFFNTTFGEGASYLAIVDGGIVGLALVLALRGLGPILLMPLLLLALNFLFIAVFSGETNVKAVRDLLAPLAFVTLGWRYGGMDGARNALLAVSTLVILFAVFEFFFTSQYVRYFNVLQFYIDRGVVDTQQSQYVQNSLFVSGTRGDARSLIPVLGQHRVSSIFLEPVSVGNFGALAAAFALSLGRRQQRLAWFSAGVSAFAIIMADARFGAMCVVFFLLARFLLRLKWSGLVVALSPIAAVTMLTAMAAMDFGKGDDLPTRLALSGRAIVAMSAEDLFGIGVGPMTTLDSGYYYALRSFGLVLCLLAWLAFVALPAPGRQSQRFKLFLAIYMTLILCVSGTSLFALKTVGLGFFLFGALAAADGLVWTRASSVAIRRSTVLERA